MTSMTSHPIDIEERRKRHLKLHQSLDELLSCFLIETERLSSETTLMEFMKWSHQMTEDPTCVQEKADVIPKGSRRVH